MVQSFTFLHREKLGAGDFSLCTELGSRAMVYASLLVQTTVFVLNGSQVTRVFWVPSALLRQVRQKPMPQSAPRKIRILVIWPSPFIPRHKLGVGGVPSIIWHWGVSSAYVERVLQIFLLALLWLVSHHQGHRGLSASFWISHKGNCSVYCVELVFLWEEWRIQGFLFCHLADIIPLLCLETIFNLKSTLQIF